MIIDTCLAGSALSFITSYSFFARNTHGSAGLVSIIMESANKKKTSVLQKFLAFWRWFYDNCNMFPWFLASQWQ